MSKTDQENFETLIDLKFSERDKALELQAKEYDRRLEHLNGEAAKLSAMQSSYIPREVYEANKKEQDMKIGSLQKNMYIAMGALATLQLLLQFIMK